MKDTTEISHRLSIARVIQSLRLDPTASWRITEMAEDACMGHHHFLHVFRAVTSISPARFLAALRMERAKHILLDSPDPVTSICFEVGYQSVGTFTRLFRDFVGTSPTGLRRLRDAMNGMSMADVYRRFVEQGPLDRAPAQITGSIDGPTDLEGAIFVGAFPSPIPQGMPLGGTLLPSCGRFSFHVREMTEYACILAVALPFSNKASDCLRPSHESLLVAGASVSSLTRQEQNFIPEIRLRRLTEFDPPVLTALPPPIY